MQHFKNFLVKQVLPMLAIMVVLTACSIIGMSSNSGEERLQTDYAGTISVLENELQGLSEKVGTQVAVSESVTTEIESLPTVAPVVERLPSEPVPASVPIVYDGWSMAVSQELYINSNANTWGIKIYLTNLGDTQRVFRFTNSAITATDNLGNVYPPSWKVDEFGFNCEPFYYTVKNLSVEGEESVNIKADDWWDLCDNDNGINTFVGPIPREVEQLFIHIDGFGPYTGVTVVIDL